MPSVTIKSFMRSTIILSAVALIVVILSFVMLRGVAPFVTVRKCLCNCCQAWHGHSLHVLLLAQGRRE